MKITIGANIKRLRLAKNITQEQLSVAMNVTCAAVSKWERGDTYPEITLLQPLAYYFGVTLDELMGYNQERIQTEIEEIITLYKKHCNDNKGREIITKAYRDYPNDYQIIHYYMWDIGGSLADNNSAVLLKHKDEFLTICEKILEGCTEESLRLNAWNMRAKILHAEGKTSEALEIYKLKFTDWYTTSEQKIEQLYAKDTNEFYFYLQKNMFELADFSADKFAKTVFFNFSLSLAEKSKQALRYGEQMLTAFKQTKEAFFLVLAKSFLGRMENDLCYRGGTDEQIIAVMDKNLYAIKLLEELKGENPALLHSFDRYPKAMQENLFKFNLNYRLNATNGRRAELLKNPKYRTVLENYK
jgi:transcriptional regulator with XRE-family HTH domain